jgi:hypothetical protein
MDIIVNVSDFDKIKNIIDSDITIEELEEALNTEKGASLLKEKPELALKVLKFIIALRKNLKRNYRLNRESFDYQLMRKIANFSNGKYTVHQI